MSEQNEQIIFEIISHGGNAKSLAYEALDAATAFNFEQANELMAESKQEMSKAHNIQTELIQSEINGDKVDRKSTRLNSSHSTRSRMPSSA